jgi:hypothetical protein
MSRPTQLHQRGLFFFDTASVGAAAAASAGAAAAASAREAPACPKLSVFVMESRLETRPEYDVDSTLCPEGWEEGQTRRKMRNEMIKDQLQAGRSVCYRSSG